MENESGMSVKGFILRVILVVLFVFLLMWLFPMPNLEPVYDSIFAQNIETMKGAAKDYYTVERLPKEVGQSVRMTLDEMLSMKLLLPLKDSDGDTCSGSSSYVEVSKTDTEYLIKTQLTCPNKADYIITHFGCYDICSDKCKVAEQTSTDKSVIKKTDYKPTPTPSKYLYTYRKDWSETTYGPWTNWSSEIKYADSDNISFGCTDTKCTEEAPDSPKNEVVGTKLVYDYSKPIYRTSLTNLIGNYTITACTGYNYVIYQNTGTYSYPSGTTWNYVGTFKYSGASAPNDTPTTKYEYVSAGFDEDCRSDVCSSEYVIFKKYVLESTLVTTSTSSTSINITCSNYSTKTVPVYGTKKEFVDYESQRVNIYASVKYYRYRTRPKNTTAAYDIKTRTYKDQSLINNGYRLISTAVVK